MKLKAEQIKKALLLITAVLTTVAFAIGITIAGCYITPGATSAYKYIDIRASVRYDKARSYTDGRAEIILPKGRDLKILVLADPQFYPYGYYDCVGANNEKTYAFIERLLEVTKPDLTVIAGDLTYVRDYNPWHYYERLAELFEEKNALWAFCFGNHDSENTYTKDLALTTSKNGVQLPKRKLVKALSAYPHCMTYVQGRGNGFNYTIDVTDGKNLVRSLIFLDCEYAEYNGEPSYSRVATEDQIEFYEREIERADGLDGDNNSTVESTVFMHVRLPEYFMAAKELLDGNTENAAYHYGDWVSGNYAKFDEPDGLFESMLALGSTDSVYFGHHHDNDLSLTYKGIRMTTVQHSGFSYVYRTDHRRINGVETVNFTDILKYGDNRGGVLLTVNGRGELAQQRILGREVIPEYAEDFAIDYSECMRLLEASGQYKVIDKSKA